MKKAFSVILICLILLFSCTAVTVSASSIDEAVISSQDDKYVPLHTISPDSSLKDYNSPDFSSKDSALFYTQTTLLALIADYLILFKVKGINHDEKMHRRKEN
ncbi:hypothetical protein [uncultured Ruminococcus sp.]|uniref:hypothetical protein n=1 Tax=uncultured Ruminococcus sp. TaxID=165186 RepID=UPI0025D97CB0|nr:hypothetical protein [uncultured Ruminococcus sp.]